MSPPTVSDLGERPSIRKCASRTQPPERGQLLLRPRELGPRRLRHLANVDRSRARDRDRRQRRRRRSVDAFTLSPSRVALEPGAPKLLVERPRPGTRAETAAREGSPEGGPSPLAQLVAERK